MVQTYTYLIEPVKVRVQEHILDTGLGPFMAPLLDWRRLLTSATIAVPASQDRGEPSYGAGPCEPPCWPPGAHMPRVLGRTQAKRMAGDPGSEMTGRRQGRGQAPGQSWMEDLQRQNTQEEEEEEEDRDDPDRGVGGWQVWLVMEYMPLGSLRAALDAGAFNAAPGARTSSTLETVAQSPGGSVLGGPGGPGGAWGGANPSATTNTTLTPLTTKTRASPITHGDSQRLETSGLSISLNAFGGAPEGLAMQALLQPRHVPPSAVHAGRDMASILSVAQDVACAMAHLHSVGILHAGVWRGAVLHAAASRCTAA